jgi:hypothetical protein
MNEEQVLAMLEPSGGALERWAMFDFVFGCVCQGAPGI